jgi:hypothetical protein
MNGPEHYREAERLLAAGTSGTPEDVLNRRIGRAQVHATLALAAATALNDGNVRAPIADCQEWVRVASVVPATESAAS